MAATSSSPSRLIPPVINAYSNWGRVKTFDLCGASREERLYIVESHSGFSGKKPLGFRPGLLLHAGMSRKDPILAAAGNESPSRSLNPDTIVLLPCLDPSADSSTMAIEKMRLATTAGSLRFSIEVSEEMQREEFEWRKIKKGEDSNAQSGGFRLVRLSSGSQRAQSSSGSETVAILAWTMKWIGSTHGFTLQLMGTEKLGERWALMTVMTTLRLFSLHVSRKLVLGLEGTRLGLKGVETELNIS
ncbi:hypothetical protein F5884DRAFT_764709 [Xylogone sp. PMI_703]|nr:hypothetical protein F5884DRAFT_764709 [Xylogone sp. PMI_703]